MTEGQDRTGLGPLRIPIFAGAAIFFFWKGLSDVLNPPEIIAAGNATLIQGRIGLNPNTMFAWVFGPILMVAGIIFGGVAILFIHFYLTKPKESVSV